jgi:hypothetical protein
MHSEQSILRVDNWGYQLFPESHYYSAGYNELDIFIREKPSDRHYDPESVRLQLRDRYGFARWTTLEVGSAFKESRHVCPGRVILHDRVDKRVQFFSFGGSLEAVTNSGGVMYCLRSSAPVLGLNQPAQRATDQFVFETEEMIGKLKAEWEVNDAGFDQRLAQVDPLQFYLASVFSVLAHLKDAPALQQSFAGLYAMLSRERTWLRETGHWPTSPLRLEELLAPE